TVAPLRGAQGAVESISATITVLPADPDWEDLAGLAHDLRTPLQTLKLVVPVLEALPMLHPAGAEALERLRGAAERALAISGHLLARCTHPPHPPRRAERDGPPLPPLLQTLADEQVPAAQRKGISLAVDIDAARRLEAHTDKVRLGRLLANLLVNAVR